MNSLNRDMRNSDGSVDSVVISSNDNYTVSIPKAYKLVGYGGNKFNDKIKSSILLSDIGINSLGFTSVMFVSSVIALGAVLMLYFSWRV